MDIKRDTHNTLIVLVGPTGIGKTELSLSLAEHLGASIISSDSRQIYKGIKIGTAAPTPDQLERVSHHFVAIKELDEYYNAFEFEKGVLQLLNDLFPQHPVQMMVGGSMMYVDAVCKGIDEIPDIDPHLRQELKDRLTTEGLDPLRSELKKLDPDLYDKMDIKNPKRILHALEVCYMTGKPYSSFRSNKAKERNFNILKIGLNMDREQLYDRINRRVDQMIEEGLEQEARQFFHLRHLNSLNTVGYKEMFEFIEGKIDLPRATELIKRNTRRYAKKQLTWFKRDPEITWFHPKDQETIFKHVDEFLATVKQE